MVYTKALFLYKIKRLYCDQYCQWLTCKMQNTKNYPFDRRPAHIRLQATEIKQIN